MSMTESLMRRTLGADNRLDTGKIVFENEYGNSFKGRDDKLLEEALETVRLAPSARNKQPWRLILSGNEVHFYEKKDAGFDRKETGDIKKTDIGIAMCHFTNVMEKGGRAVSLKVENPGLSVPDGVVYVSTYVWGE